MDFSISDKIALTGSHSAHLYLDASGEINKGVRVTGIVRDLENIHHLPRYLGGSFRVEKWKRGTPVMYLQTVVVLVPEEEGKGFPQFTDPKMPLQLSFILAGIEQAPFYLSNRRFIIADIEDPAPGKWVSFRFDLYEAFKEAWEVFQVTSIG